MIALFLTECTDHDEHFTAKALAEYGYRQCFGTSAVMGHASSGKPCFLNVSERYVSVSHSDGLCLAAISDREIGADIEHMARGSRDLHRLAERFFSSDEALKVKNGPPSEFFRLWCLKESYVKYTGEGFSRPFPSFSVLKLCKSEGGPIFSHMTYTDFAIAVCSDEAVLCEPVTVKNLQIYD